MIWKTACADGQVRACSMQRCVLERGFRILAVSVDTGDVYCCCWCCATDAAAFSMLAGQGCPDSLGCCVDSVFDPLAILNPCFIPQPAAVVPPQLLLHLVNRQSVWLQPWCLRRWKALSRPPLLPPWHPSLPSPFLAHRPS